MSIRNLKTAISLLLVLLAACGKPDRLAPQAYVAYLSSPQSGMRKEIQAGQTHYSFQLCTPEYMACRELGGNASSDALTQRIEGLKGSLFCLISLTPAPGTVRNSDQMSSYYGYEAIHDIMLQAGSQNWPPTVCHFENNLELSPANTLVTGFVLPVQPKSDIRITFNDRFSGQPMLQAIFSGLDLQQLPSLLTR